MDIRSSAPTGNLFLDALSPSTLEAMRPHLKSIATQSGQIVYEPGQPFDVVIFPLNSIISIVMHLTGHDYAEVGIVGREGMSGLMLALGAERALQRCIVQVADGAQEMEAATFRNFLDRFPELESRTRRYAEATLMMTAQLSACNSVHPINERCARWLLMAHDRVDGDTVLLTQEFLGQMLGVRRGSVNLAASTLQHAGFIAYSRGRIVVRNRAGLESATCECYAALDRIWQEIMGYSVRKN